MKNWVATAFLLLFSLAAYSQINIVGTTTDMSCNNYNGAADGAISIVVSGGIQPYTFAWTTSDGSGLDNQAGNSALVGLGQGTYTVVVTDAVGDTSTEKWTLREPSIISILAAATDLECSELNGAANGQIDIAVSGGQGTVESDYTYAWTTTDGSGLDIARADQIGLSAGTYSLIVADVNGCTQADSYTLTEPVPLEIAESFITDLHCDADNPTNGEIKITVIGGVASSPSDYSYRWWSFDGTGLEQGTPDQSNLTPGTYCVEVRDQNDCSVSDCWTLNEATETTIEVTEVNTGDASCGEENGSININFNGRTAGLPSSEREITNVWSGSSEGPWSSGTVSLSAELGNNTFVDNVMFVHELTTTNSGWFSEAVAGASALRFQYEWDVTPEEPYTDIDSDSDDKGTALFTLTFGKPVVDIVIHIDRLGGAGGAEGAYSTNSSEWTITNPGVTMSKLTGTNDLEVIPTSFYKTPDVDATLEAEASDSAEFGTAAGSIKINSNDPLTSVTFAVTGIGVEGAGYDAVEMVVSSSPFTSEEPQIEFSLDGGLTWAATVYDHAGEMIFEGLPSGDYDVWVRNVEGTCESHLGNYSIESSLLDVNLDLSITKVCHNEEPIILEGGTPVGGTYTGAGVDFIGSTFDPRSAGAGIHTVTYTYTDSDGCSGSDFMDITVHNELVDNITDLTICEEELPIVIGNMQITESGSYTQEVTNGNGCIYNEILNLAVLPTTPSEIYDIEIQASELPYVWKGIEIYEQGSYENPTVDQNGCSYLQILNLAIFGSSSTNEIFVGTRIYPNPASDVIYIETLSNLDLQMTELTGRKVLNKILVEGNNTIDVSQLHTGLYLLTLSSGEKSITKKIVVE